MILKLVATWVVPSLAQHRFQPAADFHRCSESGARAWLPASLCLTPQPNAQILSYWPCNSRLKTEGSDMGLFSSKSKGSRYEKSGSKGKAGRGYSKGKASANPDKYKPRTEAQARREERKFFSFWK